LLGDGFTDAEPRTLRAAAPLIERLGDKLIRRRATSAGLDAPPGSVLDGLVIAGMVTPALGALAAGLVLLPMSALGGAIARPISQRNLLRWPLVGAGIACIAGSAAALLLTTSTPLVWHPAGLDRPRDHAVRCRVRRRRQPDGPVPGGTGGTDGSVDQHPPAGRRNG
jgi:hypothetical protein